MPVGNHATFTPTGVSTLKPHCSGWFALSGAYVAAGRTLIALAWTLLLATAVAAEEPASPHWQFYLTPYAWVSGVTGTVSTGNPRIPAQTATASFGDILSHLNSVPVIGAFEVRYGRWGLGVDLMVIPLEVNLPTRGVAFSGASVRVTELLSTEALMYRVLQTGQHSLDLGVGVRPVALWTKINVQSGALPGFSRSSSLSWADPLLLARYHIALSDRWGLTVYGDVGGFGVGSDLTWQAMGTIDYHWNDWLVFHAGYRHLQIDYKAKILRSNTALAGPLIGATLRF